MVYGWARENLRFRAQVAMVGDDRLLRDIQDHSVSIFITSSLKIINFDPYQQHLGAPKCARGRGEQR
eukprot:2189991-Pyramimonas_sp.AAC.1